ncbi:MAG TPA: hypothetical protein PKW79_00270 [Rhabdochlamydiaceae bacterium]|nr:hypothetical protein [Rhabdochlamydiaceae bacterium]
MWRRRLNSTEEFDPDAKVYFAAASITDLNEKRAANKAIKAMKSIGAWGLFERVHLRSPTSLSAALMCCKTRTSQTAVNPSWSASGFQYNGTTSYNLGNATVDTATTVSPTSAHLFVYGAGGIDTGTGVLAGSQHTTDKSRLFVLHQGLVA